MLQVVPIYICIIIYTEKQTDHSTHRRHSVKSNVTKLLYQSSHRWHCNRIQFYCNVIDDSASSLYVYTSTWMSSHRWHWFQSNMLQLLYQLTQLYLFAYIYKCQVIADFFETTTATLGTNSTSKDTTINILLYLSSPVALDSTSKAIIINILLYLSSPVALDSTCKANHIYIYI